MSELWISGDIAKVLRGLAATHVITADMVGRQSQETREFSLGFLTAIRVAAHSLHVDQEIDDNDSQLQLSDRIRDLLERMRSEHETM